MADNYECLETGVATQPESDSNVVHGVALGQNDETNGASGKTTKWPAEVLQDAADKFEGVPIVKDHPNIKKTENGLKITGQAPIDSKVGEITQAKYKDGVGVLWQGEITDDEMLQKVEDGIAEVSPVLQRELEQVDEDTYEATEIKAVRDLGLVSKGAAESNTIETGAAAMSAEALAQEFGAEALKEVAGVEFSGTAEGKLDESEIDENYGDHALYGEGENKGDYSYWVVDADGNLRRGNVKSAWELGCRGQCPSDDTHDERVRALAEEFDDPPIDMDGESMGAGIHNPSNWEACNVDLPDSISQSDDGTQEEKSQSSVADNSEETMTEELTDNEKAILEAAEDVEDSVEALNEIAATEQATIVAQDEYEALEANVNEVRDVLTEALSEKTELKDSTIEALSFDALCDEFRDDEGDLQVEALTQVPETGEPESDEPESGAEALSEDADVDKAEALYNDMEKFGVDHEDKIVEALGVEDFDTATEVLN